MIDAHLAGLHLNHYQPLLNHYQPLRNIKERIWAIDDPSTERKLLADHVAGIITDNFELANDVKKSVLV
ncbi:hypothetical protein Q3V38_07085 [Limosilactobacillus fermentum]|uniref:hypothetical protein n=1 Tax=Limosilactobacillus fermentum TaxID=1613 RepID=UPI00273182C2|nr:hypothetical protein [Limosilactobacillus fermentum]WLF74606.1 hypothetical protein Q3V38_07085 [Limosilactobacillus fermentum]